MTVDLFDWEKSKAAKAAGMEAVEEHADEEWKEVGLEQVRLVALSRPWFTTDDVFERLADIGVTTHEHRAMGPVMTRAMKAGWCCKSDRLPVNSRRVSRHSAPLTVWRSLIYGT